MREVRLHPHSWMDQLPSKRHLDGAFEVKWARGGTTGGEGALNLRISTEETWSSIDTAVKRFWTEEQDYGVCKILSKDDKRGEKILKSTIKCENNRYTVAVMRKNDNDVYPESKSMALKRLFANERVFARKKEYAEKYDDVIQDYVNSDHAELLTVEEAIVQTPTTWYLPNFGVDNGKKVRVVFD